MKRPIFLISGSRLLLLAVILMFFVVPVAAQARKPPADTEWVVNNQYRLTVSVDPGQANRLQTPVSANVDFAAILKSRGIKGRLDTNSIRVVRFDRSTGHALPYLEGSNSYEVPYQLSHDFFFRDSGKVWWRIKDQRERNFHIYFDTLENGPKLGPRSIGLIGSGDNFHFNNNVPGRVDGSMSASVRYLDWDGDGKKDLLLGSSQTHEYGVPWDRGYIYFHKNIGTASTPLFAQGYQLRAETGEYVQSMGGIYPYFELMDWDSDGDLDLVVGDSPSLHVIENTGQRDRNALPILKKVRKAVNLPNANDYSKGYLYRFIRFVDWEGDGDLDLLYSIYHQEGEKNCYSAGMGDTKLGNISDKDNRTKVCYWGEVLELFEVHENISSPPKSEPIFASPKIVKTARGIPLTQFGYGGADYVDWDNDGDLDLLTADMQNYPQGGSRVLFYENFGTRSDPKFLLDIPVVIRDEDFGIDPNPYVTDWDADGDNDLVLAGFEGWVKVYENTNPDPKGLPQLAREGRFVLQVHPKVTGGEQTRTVIVDWNGDGLLDLIQGSGNGWVSFYENEGTKIDPVFKAPKRLRAAGEEIRLINGLRECPQGPSEPNSGYTTPVVIDFDNDGDLDLIVGDMRAYQTYFENEGSRSAPRLASGRRIQVGKEPRSFGWRNQVAAGDIDGDGKVEIVSTTFTYRHVYAYKPDPVQDDPGILKVTKFDLVLNEDGKTLLPPHTGGWTNGDNNLKLVDWDNDGDLDLLYSSITYNWYYENVGNRTKPMFRNHGIIMVEGEKLVVTGHANSVDAVDWNGDGKKDLIMSGESGWVYYFERSFIEGDLPKATVGFFQTRSML